MEKIAKKKYYSTSEVAKILQVAVGSVINWVDSKEINAVLTPGGHRKIPYEDLVTFLDSHNYEVPNDLKGTKNVYLVDDDKEAHSLFSSIFKSMKGYSLKGFYTGTEVLLAMGKEQPKIIIVDILMSDFDGIQVIKNIKQNDKLKSVQIIAVSGDATKKEESIDAGANIFLQKPISLNDIKNALK
jgi:excisionase family DNA binding protein